MEYDYEIPGDTDSNLKYCLYYNSPQGLSERSIESVLAVVEGERDGRDWFWVVRLHDGRYALIVGGCDYTGWDCQSSADAWFANNDWSAVARVLDVAAERDFAFYSYESPLVVAAELERQLQEGKAKTKKELVGEALFA